ncbi:hypothetical protein OE88DRAFT_1653282 [Heliocybe sulcata]|uniref:Uncharacterized protein n=1 Tax=Heliocybe sulcata TaxID=5364 RepID=A0A5C3NBW2_9AGAM|nr:hypothetical protein OE88DRAFT_1653282 [Heliocybe sulcata]
MPLITLLAIMFSLPSALGDDGVINKSKVLSVNSNVVCGAEYSWMDNHLQQSPCLILAYLLANCNEGSWTVPPLSENPVTHYNTPGQTGTPVDVCECSWSAYNLISACTLCQGTAFAESVHTWDNYKTNCTGYYSTTTYWPTSNFTVPNTTAIPYWASTNPSTWANGQFDLPTAENLAGQGHPDLPEPPASKKSSAGAIAGGVVGGVAGLSIILGAVAWWLMRRRRQQAHGLQGQGLGAKNIFGHKHSMSGTTYVSDYNEMGAYSTTPLDLPSPVTATSPTMTAGPRTTPVARRQGSREFSMFSDGGRTTPAGWHSRSTSGETGSTSSLHQPTQSIDAIVSAQRRTVTSPSFSLADDDEQADSGPSRPRLNPPTYADAIANAPQGGSSASHSRSQSNETVPRVAGSDIKKDKKRLAQEVEAEATANPPPDAAPARPEKAPLPDPE